MESWRVEHLEMARILLQKMFKQDKINIELFLKHSEMARILLQKLFKQLVGSSRWLNPSLDIFSSFPNVHECPTHCV